jgi:hypothetical protein
MGFIKKKTKEEFPGLPILPELPKLPSSRDFEESKKSELHELPSFPSNEFGDKFSQNTIKNAISGEEDEEDGPIFPSMPNKKIIPPTQSRMKAQELMHESDFDKMIPKQTISADPVFIQIDKFEESMETFKKIKKNIEEIEDLLRETKQLKQREEEELSSWEMEIQKMKQQIENVDRDIFSKV